MHSRHVPVKPHGVSCAPQENDHQTATTRFPLIGTSVPFMLHSSLGALAPVLAGSLFSCTCFKCWHHASGTQDGCSDTNRDDVGLCRTVQWPSLNSHARSLDRLVLRGSQQWQAYIVCAGAVTCTLLPIPIITHVTHNLQIHSSLLLAKIPH